MAWNARRIMALPARAARRGRLPLCVGVVSMLLSPVTGFGQGIKYNDSCPPSDAPGLPSDCAGRVNLERMQEALVVVRIVGGGVLAATLAVLPLTVPSSRHERDVLDIECRREPGDLGVACRFAF